jgi:hypothetical protein
VIEKGHEGHVVQRGQGGNTYMTEEVMQARKRKTAKEFVEVERKSTRAVYFSLNLQFPEKETILTVN